mgnify:CR=1 FL=1
MIHESRVAADLRAALAPALDHAFLQLAQRGQVALATAGESAGATGST